MPLQYQIESGPWRSAARDATLALPRGAWLRFHLATGGCWYGHGFAHRQPYPLNAEALVNPLFAVNNTQSPIWMCSAGVVVWVDTTAALDVRCNAAGQGCLEIRCPDADVPVRLFVAARLPAAWRRAMRRLGWPPPAPARRVLADSFFCTWTQYPRCITQDRVSAFAREIRAQRFPCSTLTIDDRWESAYGELQFGADFPDPSGMVAELHALGFRVLLWVTPFVNQEAATFATLTGRGYLVPRRDGAGPALLRWWGGTAGLIDLTNPAARGWFRGELLRLKRTVGVDGFKIDGGDAKYQPPAETAAWHQAVGPSGYADRLLELFEEVAPGMCETRTVWLSQSRRILWRQGGKDSHWGVDNGLRAVVQLGLHMALLGYDLLMPDMIPGRVQTLVADFPLPTDELFVRWVEVSALMPLMQFSYAPWNYGAATCAVARQYAQLHRALGPYLWAQARGRRGPLLRPLWFDHPDCAAFHTIGDQFLLGDDVLVAPVLDAHRVARDVHLPPGRWRDAWTGEVRAGGFRAQYPAPCPGMPLFVRQSRADVFKAVHAVLRRVPRGSVAPGVTTASYACGVSRDIRTTG